MQRLVLALFFIGLCWQGNAQPASAVSSDPCLAKLEATLAHTRFEHAEWGVKIVSLDTGKVVFEHNASKLMTPASNTKLFSGALALDRLGPDFRIKTSLYGQAKPSPNGVLTGNLVVYGRGDPTFSARFNGGDHSNVLAPLADAIVAAGVKRIEGDLVADDSYFRSPQFGSGWPWDDLQWAYAPPVSSLNLDDNALGFSVRPGKQPGDPCQLLIKNNCLTIINQVRTTRANLPSNVQLYYPPGQTVVQLTGTLPMGGTGYSDNISIQNPAFSLVTQLKESLAQKGVTVTGRARTLASSETFDASKAVEIAFTQSRPMKDIIKEGLKASQNLYAQLFLLEVGAEKPSIRGGTAEQNGGAEMKKFLKETGVQNGTAFIKEGAGLSPATQIAPSAAVDLLVFMSRHRYASLFADSLPHAGVDGTLKGRFIGTPAEKRVWAKTGTMEGISALSGYLVTQGNEHWAFSVMLNHYSGGNSTAREETDAFVATLASHVPFQPAITITPHP